MTRLAWRGALAAAALLGLVFVAGELSGWRVLAGPAERWLSQRLGQPVWIRHDRPGTFRLQLWRGIRLQAAQLRVDAAGTGAAGAALFEADTLAISATWRDLLAWRQGEPLPLESVSADRLTVQLLRAADGSSNWQSPQPHAQTAQPAAAGLPGRLPVSLGLLSARDGTLTWRDAVAQADVTVRFSLLEVAQGAGAAAKAPNPAQGMPGLQATATGSYRGLPVRGSLRTASLQPWLAELDTPQDLGLTLALTVGRAQLAFDGALKDPLQRRDLLGRFRLAGPSLAAVGQPLGLTLPTTAAFQMHGQLARRGPVWSAVVAQAAIGKSLLDGEFQFDTRHAPLPQLSGRLHARALWLADLGPSIGTRTAGQAASPRAPDRVLPDRRFDLPSLRAMNANVLLRLDRLEFGTAALQSAAPLNAHLRLRDGMLRLDDLEARLAQGRLSGFIALDGRQDRALWQAALQGRGLRLEQWLRAVQRAGQPPYAGGLLGATLRLSGSGRSTAELLASADGQLALHWTHGQISHLLVEAAGLDIAQGLGVLFKGDNPLPVSCGMADLEVRNGRVTPRAFVVDTSDSRLWLAGSLSLADERLALLARVQPKDWSPLALRAPLHIDGTLAAPVLSLDKAALASRAVPAALLAMVHPLAALIPLFDAGEPGPAQDCRSLVADRPRAAAAATGPAARSTGTAR